MMMMMMMMIIIIISIAIIIIITLEVVVWVCARVCVRLVCERAIGVCLVRVWYVIGVCVCVCM